MVSRILGISILVVAVSVLLASVTMTPTKRNIQVLAAAIFLGIVLIAHPRKALYFTLAVLPYPAYTTVGSTSALLIMALAALVMVKSRELQLPSPFQDKRIDTTLVGFGLAVLIALYQVPPEFLHRASTKTLGMISAIVLFYVLVQMIQKKEHLFTVLDIVTLVAASLYLVGFLQSVFPDRAILPEFFRFSQKVASMEEIRRGEIRVMATFSGYEMFAEYVALTLVLQYLQFRRAASLNTRLLRLAIIALGLVALFATATRSGIIILVLGWILVTAFSPGIIPRKDLLQLAFLGLALFYLSLPFFGDYYALMLERFNPEQTGQDVRNLSGRTEVFAHAFDDILDRPLRGHGFYEAEGMFPGWVSAHIHNLYLTISHKLGIPALVFFLVFVATLLIDAMRMMRNPAVSRELRTCLLFLFAVLVMFMVDQFKIEFTRDPLPMHTTFTLFGLTAAATRLARREAALGHMEEQPPARP